MIYTLFVILIVIVALLMIGIVLIQESKGGGLASNFSSSNSIMGVRKTTDVIEKATWVLVGSLVLLCICTSFINFEKDDASSIVTEMKTTLPTPAALPGQDAAAPAAEAAPVAPAENN